MSPMLRRLTLLLSALAVFGCSADENRENLIAASAIQLIADPDKFEGQILVVHGYLQNKPTLRLFVSKDHALGLDIPSSIIVSDDTVDGGLTLSNCDDNYVQITGRFDRLEGVAWALKRVQSVMLTSGSSICWERSDMTLNTE
ncbi:MAG: hypothetical protein KJP16_16215 [Gammaproteobacteria bacterium]|nr:hypothetical protein [Woeseia sp.]MBU2678617.1 hypothetical protein [Gammaproteobacteria bacterium]NNL52351.1 hypothetical protein [Woeseiaceae bacterium]